MTSHPPKQSSPLLFIWRVLLDKFTWRISIDRKKNQLARIFLLIVGSALLIALPCLASGSEGDTYCDSQSKPYIAYHQVCVDGLLHTFKVSKDNKLHQFKFNLEIENTTSGSLILNYDTGEKFDFSVFQNGKLVWHAHQGWFFAQGSQTLQLVPGEMELFSFKWDGLPSPDRTKGNIFLPNLGARLDVLMVHKLVLVPVSFKKKFLPLKSPSQIAVINTSPVLPSDHWVFDTLLELREMRILTEDIDAALAARGNLTRQEFAVLALRLNLCRPFYASYDHDWLEPISVSVNDEFSEELAEAQALGLV